MPSKLCASLLKTARSVEAYGAALDPSRTSSAPGAGFGGRVRGTGKRCCSWTALFASGTYCEWAPRGTACHPYGRRHNLTHQLCASAVRKVRDWLIQSRRAGQSAERVLGLGLASCPDKLGKRHKN